MGRNGPCAAVCERTMAGEMPVSSAIALMLRPPRRSVAHSRTTSGLGYGPWPR